MSKCISCQQMTSDTTCLPDGKKKDLIQINMKQSDCKLLSNYKENSQKHKVISLAADVSTEGVNFSANISHDKNKLILEFNGNNIPFPILKNANFNVKITLPKNGNCDLDCEHV